MVLALAGDSTTRTFIPAAFDLWGAYLGSLSRMTRRRTAEQSLFCKMRRDTDGRGMILSTFARARRCNFRLNKFLILAGYTAKSSAAGSPQSVRFVLETCRKVCPGRRAGSTERFCGTPLGVFFMCQAGCRAGDPSR